MYSSINSAGFTNTNHASKRRVYPYSEISIVFAKNTGILRSDEGRFDVNSLLMSCFDMMNIPGVPFSLSIFNRVGSNKSGYTVTKVCMNSAILPVRDILEAYPVGKSSLVDKVFTNKSAKIFIEYSLIEIPQLLVMFEELRLLLVNSNIKELVSKCKMDYITNNCNACELFECVQNGPVASHVTLLSPEDVMTETSMFITIHLAVLTIAAGGYNAENKCKVSNSSKRKSEKKRERRLRRRNVGDKVGDKKDGKVGDKKDEGMLAQQIGALKLQLLNPKQRAIEIQNTLSNHDECMVCMERYQLVDNFRGKCELIKDENKDTPNTWICGHKVCEQCFKELKKQGITSCIICKQ